MDLDDSNANKETSDDIMDESDTSSIDILDPVREIDPDAVAAKGREYEREKSRWLHKKSPANMSAPTADSVGGISSPTTSSAGSEEL
jgi:hypothetical protein